MLIFARKSMGNMMYVRSAFVCGCLTAMSVVWVSCRSVGRVVEMSEVDSLSSVRHDTVMVEKWRLSRDTVREREVLTIVKDTAGRVCYEREVHHHYESHHHGDTSRYYKVLADSLAHRLSRLEKQEAVKGVRKSGGWKKMLVISLMSMVAGMLVAASRSFPYRK